MGTFTMKTYNDSYLYKTKINSNQKDNPDKQAQKAILDFMISSHRIEDKKSDSFRGVAEEIKRQQRSNILYTVLMMDNVKLCIGPYEMPRAFKVFDAKDPKSDKKSMVFIDVTGLIELKNGYYYCKKVDVLCAYLMDALIYLLYRHNPNKLVDNSNITISATDCYVSMFTYIIDYRRIIGYSANKVKISYLTALYFLVHMMGKDLTDYTKSIAAKVSGAQAKDINAYDLYIDDGCFDNINTFINMLSTTFSLKGFTLQVFIADWMRQFGTGMEYATELLTSFLVLISRAYSASYIVGQKQVERCCGAANMIKLMNAIDKAGIDSFDNRMFMSESELVQYESHDKNSMSLASQMGLRGSADDVLSVRSADFCNEGSIAKKCKDGIEFCNNALLTDKLPGFAASVFDKGIKTSFDYCIEAVKADDIEKFKYIPGSLLESTKILKHQLSDKDSFKLDTAIEESIQGIREALNPTLDSEVRVAACKLISEYREMKQYM